MKFKLHYHKLFEHFTVRRSDTRAIVFTTERRFVVPLIGQTVELAPKVHVIITRGKFQEATNKTRPVLNVAVTRFPFVKLLIERVKEVLK